MDMGFTSSRLSKMETNHLRFTAPVGPPISLQTPNARQGAARFPASCHAYHGMQLL
jgi:hypothetical protein